MVKKAVRLVDGNLKVVEINSDEGGSANRPRKSETTTINRQVVSGGQHLGRNFKAGRKTIWGHSQVSPR